MKVRFKSGFYTLSYTAHKVLMPHTCYISSHATLTLKHSIMMDYNESNDSSIQLCKCPQHFSACKDPLVMVGGIIVAATVIVIIMQRSHLIGNKLYCLPRQSKRHFLLVSFVRFYDFPRKRK